MPPPWPSISAVLPAYNEAAVIEQITRRTRAALVSNSVPNFEILVVDDGSSDGTGEIIGRLAHDFPDVRLVGHRSNRGYGAALRSGFEAAQHEAVWLMDSDGQFDPDDLRLLLPLWGGDTIVAGYRERRQDPILRRFSHTAFFTLVRLRWGHIVRDVNCGFKLFPARVGQGLRAEGAMISTELLLRAQRSGYQIRQTAVPHYPRLHGRPTGANPGVVLRAFREFWAMSRDPEALSGLRTPTH